MSAFDPESVSPSQNDTMSGYSPLVGNGTDEEYRVGPRVRLSRRRCGGCGADISVATEIVCPGCDCPMHVSCGRPVGASDGPFRLCFSCESSNFKPSARRGSKKNRVALYGEEPFGRGVQRRSNRSPPDMDVFFPSSPPPNGSYGISHLMNNPVRSSLRRAGDKKIDVSPNVAVHSKLIVLALAGIFVVFISWHSLVNGHRLFRATYSAPKVVETIRVHPSELQADWQDSWWIATDHEAHTRKSYVSSDVKHRMDNFRSVKMADQLFSDMCGRYRFNVVRPPQGVLFDWSSQ